MRRLTSRIPVWRRESLRTNLWLVPSLEVLLAVLLFAGTYALDRAAYHGDFRLPSFVIQGGADGARQILTTMAAAVITVVGVVFSITIVALTLASTQFGPRMLRNFIRDRGTQHTLGAFVATFVYAVLSLVAISNGAHGRPEFVPNISITVALLALVLDMGVLIYFINHITNSIQLPQVIASIARDLATAIGAEGWRGDTHDVQASSLSLAEIERQMAESSGVVRTARSGYLQFVHYDTLVRIASNANAVIRLHYRPGHFLVEGHPMATVWPPDAADAVTRSLERAHLTGPYRTLAQDLSFAVDQLVEIAIRALSPAVNDTFTALTCIDWLGESLCKIAAEWSPTQIHRDDSGQIRLISAAVGYQRIVERAYEKIRQASRGMPAVMIRQLDALEKVMEYTTTAAQRDVLVEQARRIQTANTESVPEAADRADVSRSYEAVLAARATAERSAPS
jgi:uncharacterized membrane protein